MKTCVCVCVCDNIVQVGSVIRSVRGNGQKLPTPINTALVQSPGSATSWLGKWDEISGGRNGPLWRFSLAPWSPHFHPAGRP